MALTREQINEAKNFPTEKIREKTKEIKDILSSIEATKMEQDSQKQGMPENLRKEVASRVTGPIATLRKKLKETVESKKPTDDMKSNLASKKALEQMKKEAQKIKQASVALNRKVAAAMSKGKVTQANAQVAQRKAKARYEAGKAKKERDAKFARNEYATESFKDKVRGYIKTQNVNEMAMSDFAPDLKGKKEDLNNFFNSKSVDQLVNAYVKNSRARGMEDKKIAQGLGATLRGMEDKDKVAKVKEAVKKKLDLAANKPKAKKKGDPGDYDKSKDRPDAGKAAKPSFLGK